MTFLEVKTVVDKPSLYFVAMCAAVLKNRCNRLRVLLLAIV